MRPRVIRLVVTIALVLALTGCGLIRVTHTFAVGDFPVPPGVDATREMAVPAEIRGRVESAVLRGTATNTGAAPTTLRFYAGTANPPETFLLEITVPAGEARPVQFDIPAHIANSSPVFLRVRNTGISSVNMTGITVTVTVRI